MKLKLSASHQLDVDGKITSDAQWIMSLFLKDRGALSVHNEPRSEVGSKMMQDVSTVCLNSRNLFTRRRRRSVSSCSPFESACGLMCKGRGSVVCSIPKVNTQSMLHNNEVRLQCPSLESLDIKTCHCSFHDAKYLSCIAFFCSTPKLRE